MSDQEDKMMDDDDKVTNDGESEEGEMAHQTNPAEVVAFTDKVTYPATRVELINTAVKHHATEDVLAVLDLLPEKDYQNESELIEEIKRVA